MGHSWNEGRVHSARRYHALPAPPSPSRARPLTLDEAAERLGVSPTTVRRLIEQKTLPAQQLVSCAPWEISAEALNTDAVRQAIADIKRRIRRPQTPRGGYSDSMFSE
jgi:hypothetical protein